MVLRQKLSLSHSLNSRPQHPTYRTEPFVICLPDHTHHRKLTRKVRLTNTWRLPRPRPPPELQEALGVCCLASTSRGCYWVIPLALSDSGRQAGELLWSSSPLPSETSNKLCSQRHPFGIPKIKPQNVSSCQLQPRSSYAALHSDLTPVRRQPHQPEFSTFNSQSLTDLGNSSDKTAGGQPLPLKSPRLFLPLFLHVCTPGLSSSNF